MVFSRDGTKLASASKDAVVRLWNLERGSNHPILRINGESINLLAFLDINARLTSAEYYRRDMVLQIADTKLIQETSTRFDNSITSIVFSKDGSTIATTSHYQQVQLWSAKTCSHVQTLELTGPGIPGYFASQVQFSLDGTHLAAVTEKYVLVFNLQTGDAPQYLGYTSEPAASSITFSPDNQRFASVHKGDIRLWNISENELQRTWEGEHQSVKEIVFSSDSQLFATAHGLPTKELCLWSAISGDFIKKIVVTADIGAILGFSKDDSHLLTERGYITLENATDVSTDAYVFVADPSPESVPSLDVKGDWIVRGSQLLLWLPPEYSVSRQAVHKDTIALGHWQEHISVIEFRPQGGEQVESHGHHHINTQAHLRREHEMYALPIDMQLRMRNAM
jgi:WD40 repeat protein